MQDLLTYCTPAQASIVKAVEEHGSTAAAAKALGLSRSTVRSAVRRVKAKAVKQGHSPAHGLVHTVPEPLRLKGVSSYYNADGRLSGQWVKSVLDADKLELIRDTVSELCEPLKGVALPRRAPRHTDEQLFTVYPLGDPHADMLGYRPETGTEFNLDIAEKNLTSVAANLVDRAEPSRIGWVLNLGDFFHADDSTKRTPRGGHILDAEHWKKAIKVAPKIMVKMIELAKLKHEIVHVTNVPGNHDPHMSYALTMILDAYYRDDARVVVDTQPTSMFFKRHGSCLFGTMHGHEVKRNPDKLLGVMHEQRLADISACRYKYWLVGHIHHKTKEVTGCTVESFNTLAAGDNYAVSHGYFAQRFAEAITYHADYGEIGRVRCNLTMVS